MTHPEDFLGNIYEFLRSHLEQTTKNLIKYLNILVYVKKLVLQGTFGLVKLARSIGTLRESLFFLIIHMIHI